MCIRDRDKGYCATFLAYLRRRDIKITERTSGVGCCTKMLIYLVENGLWTLEPPKGI